MLAAVREHTIPGWTELDTELDAWRASGMRATFWWRDDDATRPGPRLDQLLDCAGAHPLSLAVIPAQATSDLASRLRSAPNVTVLQHGYAHANHAPPQEKKAEFGPHRDTTSMSAELAAGRTRLKKLFGDQFRPIFVPPWNRFAEGLPAELHAMQFSGLSAFGTRDRDTALPRMNCHVDIIDWRGGRRFLGTETVLRGFVDHLKARRQGAVDSKEPTGLLTHHRDHDAACWQFINDLLDMIKKHPTATWISSAQATAGAR